MSQQEVNDDTQQNTGAPAEELNASLSGSAADENLVVAEPKKALNRTTLVLFAVVALGGGGLYWMNMRTGPTSAADAPQAAAANQTISQFLGSGNNNLQKMEQMLRNTQRIVQQFLAYPSVTQVPLNHLQTNPFRLTAAKDGESAQQAEARKKQEEEKAAIKRAAETLQIQSILHGARR